MKYLRCVLIFIIFVTSTMVGITVADHLPAEHQMMNSPNSHYGHGFNKMKLDGSCDGGDCQCMMDGCAPIQILADAVHLVYLPISAKTLFPMNNEHLKNNIAYLLKRPPKA